MSWISHLSSVFVAASTIAVAVLTYFVRKASQLQFVASMTTAFQNEWHNPRAILMRDYLHSKEFEDVLNTAIEKAYKTKIPYEEIGRLLERPELKGSAQTQNDCRSSRLNSGTRNMQIQLIQANLFFPRIKRCMRCYYVSTD